MVNTTSNFTLSQEKPLVYSVLTKEQFNAEVEKGLDDIKNGRVYSVDEVETEMKMNFRIS